MTDEVGNSYRDCCFAVSCSKVERGGVFAVLGSGIGVSRQKFLNALGTATGGSPVQWRVSILIGKVRVGLGKQEQIDDVGMAFDGSPVQRRVAVAVNLRKFEPIFSK